VIEGFGGAGSSSHFPNTNEHYFASIPGSALTRNPDKIVTGSGSRAVSCDLASFVLVLSRFDLAMAEFRGLVK
jgi:hypothetical protein